MKKSLTVITLLVVALFGAFSFASASDTPSPTDVTLRMSWFPFQDYAPFLVAQEKGFYAEEGLNVKMIPGKGSGISTKLVASGENDFGIAAADVVLIAKTKGMPLKAVTVIHQESLAAVYYHKSTGIKTPKDLEGKTLAVEIQGTKYQQFISFCKKNGVDITKIRIIAVDASQERPLFFKGGSDLTLQFINGMDALLKEKGLSNNVERMLFSDYGVHMYNHLIITNEDTIKNRPDIVKKFVKASVKGWEYAISHPEEAIDILVKHYPEMKKSTELDNFKDELSVLENSTTQEHGFGYQTKERWEELQDMLYDIQTIEKKIDVTTVFTNEFLK